MASLFDFSGRVAVVVGATSGLGRAIAIGLAQHGADVVPSGRRKELVESACQEIKAIGRRTLVHPANVHDRQSIDALRDAVLKHLGRVDILVNAAGNVIRQPTDRGFRRAMVVGAGHASERRAAGVPELLRAAEGQRPRPDHQYRVAELLCGISPGRRVFRRENRDCFADAEPGLRVGEGRDSRERHRAGRVSH